jgi:8-oxo-dGTP pyrophosphatase MutT (NUDIX family)
LPKPKSHLSKLSKAGNALFGGEWLQQYAAICYRPDVESGDYVTLLITSRGTGRWVIPKGGPIKGKPPRRVAALEAYEEAGIKGKVSKAPIGRFTTMKRMEDGRSLPCLVDVFALKVVSTSPTFKESGQRQVSWVPLAQAGRLVEEPELRGIFAKLENSIRSKKADLMGKSQSGDGGRT